MAQKSEMLGLSSRNKIIRFHLSDLAVIGQSRSHVEALEMRGTTLATLLRLNLVLKEPFLSAFQVSPPWRTSQSSAMS